MALPAIREHAKMQQTLSVNSVAVSSPCAALPRAPSLSPSSSSDKSSVKSKKPKRVQQKNYNPSLHLKDEVTPIRRRFHSSDIILRGSGGLAKFKNLQENRWIKDRKTYKESGDNNNFSENSEEEYEPEPPLDSAELARLRRRTFSENFTKSSRVPSSFYQREPAFHAVEEFQELYRDDWEEECKSEDELVVDRMLRQLDEEMEDEVPLETGRQQDDYFDGSWVSQSSAMEWTPGNHSVESDGQNLEKLHNLQKLYQEGFITVTEYKDRRVQLVDELSEADQSRFQV
ncbi:hypothetical protein PHYBOEH_004586 [Phytophthora boehmeriae]|uniref:Uncharacterized protein n=1 Tax=Phytophthora boehmeriae TaxID=109152 RepID=A0A8T1WSX1_9STRA|nr:hypothetical protein PHYBOEH_004586 [Phytophthora boehmeriae]